MSTYYYPEAVSMDEIDQRIPDETPGPEKLAEQRDLITKAFAVMSKREKYIITRISEGDSEEEIAAQLAVQGPTIRKALSRARAKVREALGE
jgi:DNA-directed RNA polymerase specialized sigma24 family protein